MNEMLRAREPWQRSAPGWGTAGSGSARKKSKRRRRRRRKKSPAPGVYVSTRWRRLLQLMRSS